MTFKLSLFLIEELWKYFDERCIINSNNVEVRHWKSRGLIYNVQVYYKHNRKLIIVYYKKAQIYWVDSIMKRWR